MRRHIVEAIPLGDQLVQLRQGGDLGHGHHVATTEPADLALHATLLVCPVLARTTVEGVEEIVAAQSDEALGLGPVATHQHPGDGGLEVVVADAFGNGAEVLEGPDVPVDEGLLGLVGIDAVKALARRREAHDEHPRRGEHAVEVEADRAEVDLSLVTERVGLGDHDLGRDDGTPPLGGGHVVANRGLGRLRTVLVDQALPDSPGGVALLLGDA